MRRITLLIPAAALACAASAHAADGATAPATWTPSSHVAASAYAPAKSPFDAGFKPRPAGIGEQTVRNLAGLALQATAHAEPAPRSGTLKYVNVGDIGYRRDPVTGGTVPVQ
ncbi:hypothetical protein [Luteibacter yeojuensis]|uniref:Uncharacterized protein n=1 Tax=Luteibacter yeojuensis TaxID=345309 RepID=A0A0F3KL28_9GAMM|nr:hypothetical protein [Luteibacter yeojuensis]KJV31667.1 hypothetical protein VI08_13475 [Luteibacter yeojuensis]